MNTNAIKFLSIILIIAGSFSSCTTEEDDIDMSHIDFSNIENLYEQPLPVIKKCVQGKWKPFVALGGDSGPGYYDDTRFRVISTDRVYNYVNNGESMFSFKYIWKRMFVEPLNHETYVMRDVDRKQDSYFFHSIKNDTLVLTNYHSFWASDIPHTFVWVRMD